MNRLVRTILLMTSFLFLPACARDSKRILSPVVPATPVTLESNHAVTATVGSEGGALTAHGSSGVTYVLTIPAGALAEPVSVTMTPIATLAALSLSGHVTGGVALRPEGLRLARSAFLHVQTSAAAGSGQELIGFSGNAAADSLALASAQQGTGELVLGIEHFSLHGAGFGTLEDLAQFPQPALNGTNQSFADRVLRAQLSGNPTLAKTLLHDWLQQVLLPELSGASNDGVLLVAVDDFEAWRNAVDVVFLLPLGQTHAHPSELVVDFNNAGGAAAPKLSEAIAGNKDLVCSESSFPAFDNMLFWYGKAQDFEVADEAHQLNLDVVLQGTCVRVVEESHSLAAALLVGQPTSLDVTFALQMNGSGAKRVAPFAVNLTATGAQLQHPDGFTDEHGGYTTVITPTTAGPITIQAHACLALLASPDPVVAPLCGDDNISAVTAIDASGTYTGTMVLLRNSAGFQSETWTFVIRQNQNALSGEFTSSNADHSGSFSATLFGTTLGNVRMAFTTTCGGTMGSTNGKCGFALDPVTGIPQTMSLLDLSYADCHTATSTDIFSGLGGFQRMGP